MFQGFDPKLVKQAMKKMGLKQESIEASQVIIKQKDKELVINNPDIQRIIMMGQESLQITGAIEERPLNQEEDIKLIIEQTKVSEKEAREVLRKADGDLAKAILELQNT